MDALAQIGKILLDEPAGLVPIKDTATRIGPCAHIIE